MVFASRMHVRFRTSTYAKAWFFDETPDLEGLSQSGERALQNLLLEFQQVCFLPIFLSFSGVSILPNLSGFRACLFLPAAVEGRPWIGQAAACRLMGYRQRATSVKQKRWVGDAYSGVSIRSGRGGNFAVQKSDGSLRSSSRTVMVSHRSDLEGQKRDGLGIVIRSAIPRVR